MAYRAPRFSHVHAARVVGASAITLSPGTADADFPVDNLIDDRAGTLFKWSASQASPEIRVDLGASFDTGIDRLIIPSNHNVETLMVEQADNVGFTTNLETLHASDTSPTPGTLYDSGTFDTAVSSRRFIRVHMLTTALFELPQIFLTKIVTLIIGPNLGDATDEMRANVSRQRQPSGISPTVQLGPQQRFIEYEYEPPITDADLTALEALIANVGMSKPFFVDPASFSTPPETDEPALAMKFDTMPESQNSIVVPQSGERAKTFELSLIESLD